eukprot:c7826_g1_i1.p1 GENE.c7826_g1_i1~~c7826_g1_i1.p1  ORF type:complete len:227 (+),score=57.63 c7826_g1_i1:30-683(+)
MGFICVLVSRGPVVLAEYATTSGNFTDITRKIIDKISPNDSRMSYQHEKYFFHYLVERGLTILCMTDESISSRVSFLFLDEIKRKFSVYEGRWQSAPSFSFNQEFAPVLKEQIKLFEARAGSSLDAVRGELDEVKTIMVDNIGKIINRGDKLESLVEKTETFNAQSLNFRRSTSQLHNKLWWQNCKTNIFILIVFLAVFFAFAATVCGSSFQRCPGM